MQLTRAKGFHLVCMASQTPTSYLCSSRGGCWLPPPASTLLTLNTLSLKSLCTSEALVQHGSSSTCSISRHRRSANSKSLQTGSHKMSMLLSILANSNRASQMKQALCMLHLDMYGNSTSWVSPPMMLGSIADLLLLLTTAMTAVTAAPVSLHRNNRLLAADQQSIPLLSATAQLVLQGPACKLKKPKDLLSRRRCQHLQPGMCV